MARWSHRTHFSLRAALRQRCVLRLVRWRCAMGRVWQCCAGCRGSGKSTVSETFQMDVAGLE
eukprot:5285594-Prymnesium_polylepis.1